MRQRERRSAGREGREGRERGCLRSGWPRWEVWGLAALGSLIVLVAGCRPSDAGSPEAALAPAPRVFQVRGAVKTLKEDGRTVVIEHEKIPGYMEAMTMPFRVRDVAELKGVTAGDKVVFRFHVTDEESWVDQIQITARGAVASASGTNAAIPLPESRGPVAGGGRGHPLMDYKFTNQLGQPVSLRDFRGSVLAITFIFTRCPVPEYCPRLTKNFQEVSRKLSAVPGGPTNWHLLSFTIDPGFDTPKILKSYAERHQYDPAKWSFLTGPAERMTELVRESGVKVEPEGGLFNHNFRTLIVGTNGQLQASIPIGGPISDAIVEEMRRALGVADAPRGN